MLSHCFTSNEAHTVHLPAALFTNKFAKRCTAHATNRPADRAMPALYKVIANLALRRRQMALRVHVCVCVDVWRDAIALISVIWCCIALARACHHRIENNANIDSQWKRQRQWRATHRTHTHSSPVQCRFFVCPMHHRNAQSIVANRQRFIM